MIITTTYIAFWFIQLKNTKGMLSCHADASQVKTELISELYSEPSPTSTYSWLELYFFPLNDFFRFLIASLKISYKSCELKFLYIQISPLWDEPSTSYKHHWWVCWTDREYLLHIVTKQCRKIKTLSMVTAKFLYELTVPQAWT